MDGDRLKDGRIPLGLCKQAVMKLDSFMSDINEIKDDPDLEDDDRDICLTILETSQVMMAHIINIVSKEMEEEEFLKEDIPMDHIEEYPHCTLEELEDPLNCEADI